MIKFVTGFAGAGKSTELAKRATKETLVLTPTHKAAEVLKKKGIVAYTIHSVLKLVPTINKNFRKGQNLQSLKMMGDTDLEFITDIFIDEFSMINKEILDMLLELIPEHCEVTIFGDPYQLPPVSGKRIKPKKYSKDIHELKIQYRAEAPEVVETLMRFVEYIKTGEGDSSVNLLKGDLSTFNPLTDRALAFTNAKVSQMNEEISKHVAPTNEVIINGIETEVIAEDNESIFTFPKMMSKGHTVEDEDKCNAILDNIEKYNIDLSDYKIICVNEGLIHIDYNHYENSKRFKKDVEKYQNLVIQANNLGENVDLTLWCRNNRGGKYVKERGRAWSTYMNHKDLVWDIRSRFASTVHKAQGQEFETVYIAMDDLKLSADMYPRLMYVALSRAIKKVVIV